jgi:Domain of unknown function (DUF4269)
VVTPPSQPEWPEWRDIAYLARGTARQRRAHSALVELGVLRDLAPFDATLVGTVPLAIDLPESDLDIVCRAPDPARFEDALRDLYAGRTGFRMQRTTSGEGRVAVVAGFAHAGETVELFGQELEVPRQNGFRHMVVEARLLRLGGERLRQRVLARKRSGVPTEPAFAEALGLTGDPYRQLFELSFSPEAELAAVVGGRGGPPEREERRP